MDKKYTITVTEWELGQIIAAVNMRMKYYERESENQENESLDRYMHKLTADGYHELLEKFSNL